MPGQGTGVRRPRRSRERGVAAVPVAARQQAARRSRHPSERDVPRSAIPGGRRMTTPTSQTSNATSRVPTGQRINSDLLRPLMQTSWRFYLLVAMFGGVVAAALVAWMSQVTRGFGITGIRWPVYWGFYITSFVFWIGISHAGTLISAILRLVNAGWRRPVTRCAEVITVFALMIGAMFPVVHLGRPWLAFWLFPYPSERMIWPNLLSPLVWDFFAINTYLTGSVLFLFLPMIPDLAVVRDTSTGHRHRIYRALALGWRGTPKQWHRLEAAMQIMAGALPPPACAGPPNRSFR